MFSAYWRHFPSRLFCLSNVLFWLIMTTIAADHTHRTRLFYGRESDFALTWIEYLPWWGNWAIVAPFVVAAIRMIPFEEGRTLRFLLRNLALMAITMLVYWALSVASATWVHSEGGWHWSVAKQVYTRLLVTPMHLDVLVYLAIASLGFTMHYYSTGKEQVIRNEQLSNQLLKVELQALKSQLSPHFLFNTLNTISGLVRMKQPEPAIRALSELSKMFRKVLENQKNQMSTLATEMEFIDSYLSIQKMRFDKKLNVQLSIDEQSLDCHIPFMLLHTLVENAVQHGSQLESDENLLKLSGEFDGKNLTLTLTNRVCQSDQHQGFGIGLENCRQRLRHIYGEDYSLVCAASNEELFTTTLKIPAGGYHA